MPHFTNDDDGDKSGGGVNRGKSGHVARVRLDDWTEEGVEHFDMELVRAEVLAQVIHASFATLIIGGHVFRPSSTVLASPEGSLTEPTRAPSSQPRRRRDAMKTPHTAAADSEAELFVCSDSPPMRPCSPRRYYVPHHDGGLDGTEESSVGCAALPL